MNGNLNLLPRKHHLEVVGRVNADGAPDDAGGFIYLRISRTNQDSYAFAITSEEADRLVEQIEASGEAALR